MKIHADDCPAFDAHFYVEGFCRCTARADLAELVAAAGLAEEYISRLDSSMAWQIGVRLLDALKPFREEIKP